MAITAPGQTAAPEKPNFEAARQGGGGEDRAGFDLGGTDATRSPAVQGAPGSPVYPESTVSPAAEHNPATDVRTDGGDDRAIGGPAGGTKPGEIVDAAAGAVRPPRTVSTDRTFTQGNPDDAA